mmetsp:Transcript_7944/g.14617  ORF Transcript_7944/g.14617 Transcript_7944/m.14617 type:complete len:169 (+) Transcript_7944:1-507(+)
MVAISRVQDEARTPFQRIRQNLHAMELKRTSPKKKKQASRPLLPSAPISNPPTDGLACKAGKTYFVIQVGEPANLYKTLKPSGAGRYKHHHGGNGIMIDLHGLMNAQALVKLRECLPVWMDMAMKRSYPFLIQVKIVCGGGNQVLSEAVKNWIRQNDNVANAPKRLFA